MSRPRPTREERFREAICASPRTNMRGTVSVAVKHIDVAHRASLAVDIIVIGKALGLGNELFGGAFISE